MSKIACHWLAVAIHKLVSYEAIDQQPWTNDRNRFDLMWKILEAEPTPPPS